jgi:hypothetical protein
MREPVANRQPVRSQLGLVKTDGSLEPPEPSTNMPLADSRTPGATRGRTYQWRGAVLGGRVGPRAPRGGLWPLASGRSASLASVFS